MDDLAAAISTTTAASSGTLHALLSLRAHVVYYHLVEALFFLLIIYLAFSRAYKPWARNPDHTLSPSDQAARLAQWKPLPLAAPPLSSSSPSSAAPLSSHVHITDGGAGPTLTLDGVAHPVLNLATSNFLGLLKNPQVEAAALATMRDYGCGACGPRGFYGTTDLHLKCEDALAKFSHAPSAILYSFGAATANSTIPAFIKRGDLIVIDDALAPTLRLGVRLSRARVLSFRHNDMAHLRQVLQSVVADDLHTPTLPTTQRRLIIVEGISAAIGDVCPLDAVVALKNQYGFRLFVDESISLGVLGHSGKGALQEFSVSRPDVEIATADLGNAIASVGGVCVGADDVVDHQRLSGAGYCFSASQPPFLATAATTAIQIISRDGDKLVKQLRERIATFLRTLHLDRVRSIGWNVVVDHRSPLIHFRWPDPLRAHQICTNVHQRCLDNAVLVALSPSQPLEPDEPADNQLRVPSIRVTLSVALSLDQVVTAANAVRDALCTVHIPHNVPTPKSKNI